MGAVETHSRWICEAIVLETFHITRNGQDEREWKCRCRTYTSMSLDLVHSLKQYTCRRNEGYKTTFGVQKRSILSLSSINRYLQV